MVLGRRIQRRPLLDQEADQLNLSGSGRIHQSRLTVPIPDVDVCPALKEITDLFKLALLSCCLPRLIHLDKIAQLAYF